ncbi:sensor histidine kinase [Thermophilibacter provencensis]|uniref:Sensor-like histidine kinase SenX3 n=1 Tax=Thermophilibacter provencensis TaxID=1852386 RepID=A0ABT7V0L6_9ACTN|nr:sensor histidine kinase [Thermophilibacter provencensis]MDM8270150.1 sensor histidine kinase [Thermophilibacter provencensis]
MGFGAYIADRLVPLVVGVMALAFCALVMSVYGLDAAAVAFVCAVLVIAAALALLLDWLHRRAFYQRISDMLDALDETYLATELVERPGFLEGELFYDALDRESKAMRDRIASARRRSREYREYVETWVHEIKTPIAAAHLIAKNNPSPEVDAMDAEVDAIEGYVEQALYYSRGTSLEKDLQIREVLLAEVVRDALRHKARTLIGAHVAPELGELDYTVRADPKWLSFVIGQVLVNAAKYRGEKDGSGCVRISAARRETGLDSWETVLSIADDGVGIPASDVGRVFDKGFTGENGRRFARSTGMGLYLVRELCDKMGISVWLESEEGVGTTVHLAFPDMVDRG